MPWLRSRPYYFVPCAQTWIHNFQGFLFSASFCYFFTFCWPKTLFSLIAFLASTQTWLKGLVIFIEMKWERFRHQFHDYCNGYYSFYPASVLVEIKAREKKVSFEEEVEVRTIEPPTEIKISTETMDQCLEMLQNTDPTMERPDNPDMPLLEGRCLESHAESQKGINPDTFCVTCRVKGVVAWRDYVNWV